MKIQLRYWILSAGAAFALVGTPFGHAQGFINLNFESANIVPIPADPAGRVQFGPAFPGWTAYFNATPLSFTDPVNYNNPSLGTAAIGLVNSASPSGGAISNQTVLLQGSSIINGTTVSLAQTGLVPTGTMSLRFQGANFGPSLFVSLGGQPLNLGILQDFGSYREYGADISSFAGQSAELRFVKSPLSGDLYFDNISFSTVGVPEPGTWALIGLGSALFWCAARRRK